MTNYNERLDEILRRLILGSGGLAVQRSQLDTGLNGIEAKQAITSLIKDLVTEAKPTRSETQIGNFIIYGDLSKRDLNIIDQFEQNILKALEEV